MPVRSVSSGQRCERRRLPAGTLHGRRHAHAKIHVAILNKPGAIGIDEPTGFKVGDFQNSKRLSCLPGFDNGAANTARLVSPASDRDQRPCLRVNLAAREGANLGLPMANEIPGAAQNGEDQDQRDKTENVRPYSHHTPTSCLCPYPFRAWRPSSAAWLLPGGFPNRSGSFRRRRSFRRV